RDSKTASGWNNAVFPNVGMPHALWTLQGERAYDAKEHKWSEVSKGSQSSAEYDATVRDLVNFLVYVGEPAAAERKTIGIMVLFVLGVLFIFAYLLKKEFWKDVK
ncbi:MAG: cytochrome c1, partial [Burkholderiales bacterium]